MQMILDDTTKFINLGPVANNDNTAMIDPMTAATIKEREPYFRKRV